MNRAAVLAAALALSSAAAAQPMDQATRNYVRSGVTAFEERRFAEAARAFREAHAISHRPELLFNIGRAEAAAGNLTAAVEALTLFRDAGAPNFDRAALDAQIQELRAQQARPLGEAARSAQQIGEPLGGTVSALRIAVDDGPKMSSFIINAPIALRENRELPRRVRPTLHIRSETLRGQPSSQRRLPLVTNVKHLRDLTRELSCRRGTVCAPNAEDRGQLASAL